MESKTTGETNFDLQEEFFKEIQALQNPREILEKQNIANILLDIIADEDNIDIINISLRYNFTEILIKITDFACEQLKNQLDESTSIILLICANITYSFSNYSMLFCEQFHKADGIALLFKILQSQVCENARILEKVNESALSSLHNLARLRHNYLDRWGEKPVEVIMDVIKKYGDTNSDIRITGCKYSILFLTLDDFQFQLFLYLKIDCFSLMHRHSVRYNCIRRSDQRVVCSEFRSDSKAGDG